ncbi:MAG: glycosyltransferase, partial [Planctomycetota bacterium]
MISFEIFYLSLMAWISVYGVHRFWLVWGARANPDTGSPVTPLSMAEELSDAERVARFPRVIVQLPIYNEPAVIERLLESAAALDWPRDRLEIQVLDDSTDGSSEEVARRVEALRDEGVPIFHLHREDRTGFKAGALQAGLERTEAEFVAMFDADFVPPADFLLRALPEFAEDGRLAMVQGRWGFLNTTANWLTRLQATLLDGHFHVEHRARAGAGRFFNFNGTAGVWRIEAIRDSGDWRSDTITEDLELSLRAWLRGWRFRYRPDLVAPSELPERMAAF